MTHCVVNVATGRYVKRQQRLHKALDKVGYNGKRMFWGQIPPGCPAHDDVPFAFKPYAIAKAYDLIGPEGLYLWMDSSVVPIRPLDPLFELIEQRGYWIVDDGWQTGQWCVDSALKPLGITRGESWCIPHPIATVVGFNLAPPTCAELFRDWFALAKDGTAFRGPTYIPPFGNSKLPGPWEVGGHRHDQTVLGVLAWQYGLIPMQKPRYFAHVAGGTEETILVAGNDRALAQSV